MTTIQNHDFTMDPNLLVSVIKSQAGTLSKALLEGVMNSIDAGASRIDIKIDGEQFSIEDNGRGFTSDEEIRNWFGRFGTPHVAGDTVFGKFRMGRGQLMAFAATEWRSGPFQMNVDLEKLGLTYNLTRCAQNHTGCSIIGKLYQPLPDYKLKEVLTEMRKFVAYTSKPVYVNGELYGAEPSSLKTWTHEDDDAYYRIVQDAHELKVYNQGVFVEEQGTWRTGMGGIVVSKAALEVNFARNSVMENTCLVWRRITKRLEDLVLRKLSESRKLDDGERRFLARRMDKLQGHPNINLMSVKVLTDPSGKHVSLGELRNFRRFVHIAERDSLACAVHGEQGTFVVTDELLTRFGESTLSDLLRVLEQYPGVLNPDYEVIDVSKVVHMGLGSVEELDADGLTRKERAAFRALEYLNVQLAEQLTAASVTGQPRKLLVGKHKTGKYVAWTDGKEYITANKRHLKLFERGLNGVTEWVLTLVHEYMHDSDDSESHSHAEIFYRKFHDTVFLNGCLSMTLLAQKGLAKYLKELVAEGVSRPRELSRQLKGPQA